MSRGRILTLVTLVTMAIAPFGLDDFWLRMGVLVMAASIGAIGLDILVGVAGQVSLAHSVFLAAGAYLYVVLSSPAGDDGYGFGLPPLVALICAVGGTGLIGALLGPIAGRLRGLQLAIATIGLVMIAELVLQQWTSLTGGYAGREVPPFAAFGLDFSDDTQWVIFNVPLGMPAKLWFLCLTLLVVGYVMARRIVRGRPGLALHMVRESEIGAAAVGVRVPRYKRYVFVLAAMFGGLAGVLIALSAQFVVPTQFGFVTSADYLVMIILGGLGSVRGAIAGAAFVTTLPILLQEYSGSIPFLSPVGSGGIDANIFGTFLYAGLLVVVIMFARGGLDTIIGWLVGKPRTPKKSEPPATEPTPAPAAATATGMNAPPPTPEPLPT